MLNSKSFLGVLKIGGLSGSAVFPKLEKIGIGPRQVIEFLYIIVKLGL
jgi:hypothetical protein